MTCGERFIGCSAVSAIISNMVERVWGITFDAFAYFWGRNSLADIPSQYFVSNTTNQLKFVQQNFPFSVSGLLDRLQPIQSTADEPFRNGRVDATQEVRETCWKNWCYFIRPLGF